jgi:hypothetical protein
VGVVHNSARSKQSTRRRSSSLLTALSARIVILGDQRESKGPSFRSLRLAPSPSSLPGLSSLLIANLELEFRASARKQMPAPRSNRKYSQLLHSPRRIAISCPEERWSPSFLATRHPSLSTGFLIETPRLKFAVSSTKQSTLQISNRDKMRVLQIAFVSDPLSSAPNLAIIEFPGRGHL